MELTLKNMKIGIFTFRRWKVERKCHQVQNTHSLFFLPTLLINFFEIYKLESDFSNMMRNAVKSDAFIVFF